MPFSHFCWPVVLSLTFAQLMILAEGMGQLRLFFMGSCASDHSAGHSHHPGSPEWTGRATFAEELGRKKINEHGAVKTDSGSLGHPEVNITWD